MVQRYSATKVSSTEGPRILRWLVYSLVLVMFSVVVASYLNIQWTDLLIFKVDDGWCHLPKEGVGRHCFGDFGLAYFRGDFYNKFHQFYVKDNYVVTNTPPTIVLFMVLKLLPYNFALALYQIIGLALCGLAVSWGAANLRRTDKAIAIVLGGLLTYGTLSAIDRGNHVILLVFPSVVYLKSIVEKRWLRACFALLPIALLKFWGPVLVLPLLIARRWREALLAAGATLLGYLIPLALFPGGLTANFHTMFAVNSRIDIANLTMPYNISFNGFISRTICAVRTQTWCNTSDASSHYQLERLVPLLALLFIVALVVWVCSLHREEPQVYGAAILLLPILAIPDAAPYNSVFAVAILSVVLRYSEVNNPTIQNRSSGRLRAISLSIRDIALLVSLTPVAFRLTTTSILASSNGGSNPIIRIQYWLIAPLWIAYLILEVIRGLTSGLEDYRA